MHRSLPRELTSISWGKSVPFFLLHLAPIGMFWFPPTTADVAVCGALYVARMFLITGVYHRYFSHRSYEMGRVMQFLMAFAGTSCAQKGPLWWASHHRMHHKFSDTERDIHSPKDGAFWSHVGWIISNAYDETEWQWIKDFAKYPELRFLNRYHEIAPILLGVSVYLIGGWSMLFCGFFLSTVLLYHGTFSINSLMHVFGRRRYATKDTSRNSLILALITLGEGWHNNHHYYQSSTNQGFYWWEIDISYYTLKVLSWVGLVRGIRNPPQHILDSNRVADLGYDPGMQAPSVAPVPAAE